MRDPEILVRERVFRVDAVLVVEAGGDFAEEAGHLFDIGPEGPQVRARRCK